MKEVICKRPDRSIFYRNIIASNGQRILRSGEIYSDTENYDFNIAEYIEECLSKGNMIPEKIMSKLIMDARDKGILGTDEIMSLYRNTVVDGNFTVTRKRYASNLLEVVTPSSYVVYEVKKEKDGVIYTEFDHENCKRHKLYKKENILLFQNYISDLINKCLCEEDKKVQRI